MITPNDQIRNYVPPPPGAPTLGEARRDPATGMVVLCTLTWDRRVPVSPVDTAWLVIVWGDVPFHAGQSCRLDFHTVVDWPVIGRLDLTG